MEKSYPKREKNIKEIFMKAVIGVYTYYGKK
jgi:hypothetical protein